MNNPMIKTAIIVTALLLIPVLANAECSINGHITVEETNSPLGVFEYTLTVSWDMDSPHGLSHLDLVIDGEGGSCACDEFSQNITFPPVSGTSDGVNGCLVEYTSQLACDGDPSFGFDGKLFKFEPIDNGCEPGPVGTGTFVFYSNLPAAPIDEQAISLIDKAGTETCSGTLSGFFPGMECDPVAVDGISWGSLKGLYR